MPTIYSFENSNIISNIGAKGLVCHYRFEEGLSQFIFLDIDKETGGISVNNPLSLTTSSFVQIISSSEGLLLLSSIGENQLNYLVFNPSTKRSVILPQHGNLLLEDSSSNKKCFRGLVLAIDNDLQAVFVGI